MEKLTIENLSYTYPNGGAPALCGVGFSVNAGEFILLTGRSGCGKTTLLKQLKPSVLPSSGGSGRILIDGAEDDKLLDSSVGFVFQSPEDQFVTETVWHELAFGLESVGCDGETMRRRVAEVASFFGLEDCFDKKVSSLSGGQKQMTALASVMAMEPDILVLDEPVSRLDPISTKSFTDMLRRLHDETGVTVLVSSHDTEAFLPICSRVLVMEDGCIISDASPRDTVSRLCRDKNSLAEGFPTPAVFSALMERERVSLTVREGINDVKACAVEFSPQAVPPRELPIRDVPAVTVKDVSFAYEIGREVIKNLSFCVFEGEIYAILGGNGAGKSTLSDLIAGLRQPQSGTVKISGGVFYIPQDIRLLFTRETVYDEVYSVAHNADITMHALGKCGIAHLRGSHPYDLSGGEQQRLAIAMMTASNRDILILDEPTKGLDALSKNALREMLTSLKQEGKTVLLVTHDMDFCAETADRCGLLFDGSLTAEDDTVPFLTANLFYTTAASKMAGNVVPGAVTTRELLEAFGKSIETKPPAVQKGKPDGAAPPLPPKKKKKKLSVLSLLFLVMIPLTVLFGSLFLTDRKLFTILSLVILETTASSFFAFEKNAGGAGTVTILAVLCSIAIAGRAALYAVPQFKPVLAMVILCGASLGGNAGFVAGAVTMLVSNFMFGQGTWTVFQMFAAGLIGFLAGFFGDDTDLPHYREKIAVFGALTTVILYGGILNPSYLLTYQNNLTLSMLLTSYAAGFPMDAVHGLSTALFLWLGAVPILKKIRRVKNRYGEI